MALQHTILRHWRAAACAFAMAGLVAACSPQFDGWPDAATDRKINEVEWTIADHELRFAPGTRWLAPGERARLDAFLASIDLRRPSQVYLQSAGPDVSAQLASQRVETLSSILRARGIVTQDTPPESEPGVRRPALPMDGDSAILQVAFYKVTTAGCPDWRKPTIADHSNMTSSNFGCATEQNLAAMVADPRDLMRGSEMGPADGARMGRSVTKYREGLKPSLAGSAQRSTTGGQ